MEKAAIEKRYKENRKNGGGFVFKSYRRSTGKNFEEAESKFESTVLKTKEYDELAKKAFDAEKKRLMYEKKYVNDDDAYDRMLRSKEYQKLNAESVAATAAKRAYVDKMAKSYVNVIKEAKLNDLNIMENRGIAKQFISDRFDAFVWDGNLEYNDDHFYEDWVDKQRYKSSRR